jgi:hypothetical protein
VGWNLVSGVHDAPRASERTVWLDGAAHEVAPVTFSGGLPGGLRLAGGHGVMERHRARW